MPGTLKSWIYKSLIGERLPFLAILVSAGVGIALALGAVCLHAWYCSSPNMHGQFMCSANTPFSWTTVTGLVAGPCILLTWYWRTVQKWRDISNATAANETAADSLSSNRFKDAITLFDGKDMSVFGGIHGLKALCDATPSYVVPTIAVLENFVRLAGSRLPRGENRKEKPVQREPGDPQPTQTPTPPVPPNPSPGLNTGNTPTPLPKDVELLYAAGIIGTRTAHSRRVFPVEDAVGPSAADMHVKQALVTFHSLMKSQGLLLTADLLRSTASTEVRPLRLGSLSQADLSGANLSGLDLSGLDFRMAILRDTNLSNCRLRNSDLTTADLTRATLAGADLTGAFLTKARLKDSDCRNAQFVEANADGALLIGTNLTGATVRGASFVRACRFKVKQADVDWTSAKEPPAADLFENSLKAPKKG
jgi:hypothetical protein